MRFRPQKPDERLLEAEFEIWRLENKGPTWVIWINLGGFFDFSMEGVLKRHTLPGRTPK